MAEEYVERTGAVKPLKNILPDFTKTPALRDGSKTTTNFARFSR